MRTETVLVGLVSLSPPYWGKNRKSQPYFPTAFSRASATVRSALIRA